MRNQLKLPKGRAQLQQILAASGDVIRTSDVEKALGCSRIEAAKRLARWREQGWLHRVGPGVYIPASIDTLGAERVLDDGWILVPALFEPAYIGGRTAAEHWDLTEQISKDIVVLTGQTLREKHLERQGFHYTLKHLKPDKIFGTKPIWRHNTKVQVSDVHRTVIDMLDDPSLGGGIQQVIDCIQTYLKRPDRDEQKLVAYGDQLTNGAIFKRLGFVAERYGGGDALLSACTERLTKGAAQIDPALPGKRLISRWRLFIPPSLAS